MSKIVDKILYNSKSYKKCYKGSDVWRIEDVIVDGRGATFDGRSYFDLGLDISNPMKIEIEVSVPTTAGWIYGYQDSATKTDGKVFGALFGGNNKFGYDVGTQRSYPYNSTAYTTTTVVLTAEISGNTSTTKVNNRSSSVNTTFVGTEGGHFIIGSEWQNGKVSNSMYSGDIYNFKITFGDTVYHYYFRSVNGEVMLYCPEKNQYYSNLGTGTLVLLENVV